jgi:uracil-DNA glycosylase
MPQPLHEIIAADWADALSDVEPQIRAMGDWLRAEVAAGRPYLPAGTNILRAFTLPLDKVRVLVVGQDPYPTPGHPVGLSFSVGPDVTPLPASLRNMYKELSDDLGMAPPATGDLTPWLDQGVLLLNRVLSVRPGEPGSHRGKGWEAITQRAIEVLAARRGPLVAVLWGRDARNLKPLLDGIDVVESAHPSPLSAHAGFFGSRPYSKVNAFLVAQGAAPIRWA